MCCIVSSQTGDDFGASHEGISQAQDLKFSQRPYRPNFIINVKEKDYSHIRFSGGGGVFPGEASRRRQVAYACECGDEPSGSVKCGEFLD